MGISGRAGPSRAWFILPSVLLLAGLVLGGIGVSSFLSFARSDFITYPPDSSISVSNEGFTLYAEDGALGTADLRDLRCTATGPSGQTPLQPISGRSTLSNSQGTFVAIASTPTDFPAGRYAISCLTGSSDVGVALYFGPRVDLAAVGRLAVFGIVAPLFLGLSSVALFAILVVLRHRAGKIAPAAG